MELPVNYDELRPHERKVVREEYVNIQEKRCYYCGESLEGIPAQSVLDKPVNRRLFPIGFFNNPIHLHHNHDTGMTLGAVHAYCNAILWQYHGE